jgi:plastocyanin
MTLLRHLTLTFLSLLTITALHAQVVINEISYNPPESNTDSLEYIELLNTTNFPVNLNGWHFTAGIEDTLPNIILGPGEFYVVAVNASAMMNVFGIVADEWTSGGLNNSGEHLVLVDAALNVIDSVNYDDSDPWPTLADGSGPSLELIDPGAGHNDGTNWQISGEGTGVILEGFEVFGTPGAANSGGGTGGPAITILAEHLVFHPRDAVVALGDVVRWTNPEAIPHNVNGSQSVYAGNPADIYSGAPAAGPWEFDYTTTTVGLYNYHCDVHLGQGMTGTLSVYDPNNYTDFSLDHLRTTDDNGGHIFDGVPTRVTGVVHGINFQPSGYSFYIINDQNVGINVFSFDPGSYEVAEGDLVRVSGVIDQFNGLLEIIPDEIEVLATGQALNTPAEILVPDESTESSYVFTDLLEADSAVVTGTTGFTVYAKNTNGQQVIVRFDADNDLGYTVDHFQEHTWFNVIGIGTQFDPSFPFNQGYQILAVEASIVVDGLPFLAADALSMSPNPATEQVTLTSTNVVESIEVIQPDGKTVLSAQPNALEISVDVSTLPSGFFFIKATTAEGIWTSKLIIAD